MKNELPGNQRLVPALLLGLFANVLLNGQAAYWSRTALLTALPAIALLGGFSLLFMWGWNQLDGHRLGRLAEVVFALILLASAALEALRLNALYQATYPGATMLLGICLAVVLPGIYLRRASSLAQTGNVILALVFAGCLFMVVTVAGRLQITNLQLPAVSAHELQSAAGAQLTLYPEYLLPALWYTAAGHQGNGAKTCFKLAGWAILFGTGINLILELFFGAALPQMENPVHTAARCGAISIFNRLEWMQLVLWTMAIVVKLALYLYAMVQLLAHAPRRGEDGQGQTVPLPAVAGYLAAVALLAALLQRTDGQALEAAQNAALWLLAAAVTVVGGVQWIVQQMRQGTGPKSERA